MSLLNIDLRLCAIAVLLAPFGAYLIGPSVTLALGGAYLVLMVSVLILEWRGRVDAPGTEAGMATLFLWGIAAVFGVIGAAMVALALRMIA